MRQNVVRVSEALAMVEKRLERDAFGSFGFLLL